MAQGRLPLSGLSGDRGKALKAVLPIQKRYGLRIDFVLLPRFSKSCRESIRRAFGRHLVPGRRVCLAAACGQCLLQARESPCAEFRFGEKVKRILLQAARSAAWRQPMERFMHPSLWMRQGRFRMNSAGPRGEHSRDTRSHEAAITEPVQSFFTCMVVDLRPGPSSKNYYFYQNRLGQVVFCITRTAHPRHGPERDLRLSPQVGARMVRLLPSSRT